MLIYWTHPDTREFTSIGVANESPLEPGVFAIPADATVVEPPEKKEGHARVLRDGVWVQVPDHRGEKRWDKDGMQVFVEELGEPPEDWSSEPPPPPPAPPAWATLSAEEKLEALGLSVSDLRQLLGLEG
jgi:hypothetical protein